MAQEQKKPAQPREQQPQKSQDDESAFVSISVGPSTQIQSVNYNPKTLDLVVVFMGGKSYTGATYLYRNVDQTAIAGWSNAESPGRYFNQNVKGQFEFERLD